MKRLKRENSRAPGSALVITTTTTRETGQSWDWMTIYRRSSDGNLHVTTLDAILNSGPYNAMGMSIVEYKSQPGLTSNFELRTPNFELLTALSASSYRG